MERACENCGTPDDELMAVRRMYVTPESWDTPASTQLMDEVEMWCLSCASQYPHEAVDTDDEE